ncbi:Uncharacterized protein FKW44_009515 [Caligus rogercresseyi]|uniref:Uncharacterized protein n=1 Tax=Caligus rogercresseyi TaxID=217165 RepID=A0A7T8HFU7_CALRO|nr:Uncharacterized protein FKW44_009515 [Caligus rogercresseyi]
MLVGIANEEMGCVGGIFLEIVLTDGFEESGETRLGAFVENNLGALFQEALHGEGDVKEIRRLTRGIHISKKFLYFASKVPSFFVF